MGFQKAYRVHSSRRVFRPATTDFTTATAPRREILPVPRDLFIPPHRPSGSFGGGAAFFLFQTSAVRGPTRARGAPGFWGALRAAQQFVKTTDGFPAVLILAAVALSGDKKNAVFGHLATGEPQ